MQAIWTRGCGGLEAGKYDSSSSTVGIFNSGLLQTSQEHLLAQLDVPVITPWVGATTCVPGADIEA